MNFGVGRDHESQVFFTIVLLILVTVIFSVAITEVSRGTELPALLFSSMGSTLLTLLVQCIMPDQEESFKRAAADNWFVGRGRGISCDLTAAVKIYLLRSRHH